MIINNFTPQGLFRNGLSGLHNYIITPEDVTKSFHLFNALFKYTDLISNKQSLSLCESMNRLLNRFVKKKLINSESSEVFE